MDTSGQTGSAEGLFKQSSPRSRDVHLLVADGMHQLFLPQGSRLFAIDSATAEAFESEIQVADASAIQQRLLDLDLGCAPYIDDTPPEAPKIRALSLAIAQSCNLGCSYCYARGGEFGGSAKAMSVETACKSVELLLSQ